MGASQYRPKTPQQSQLVQRQRNVRSGRIECNVVVPRNVRDFPFVSPRASPAIMCSHTRLPCNRSPNARLLTAVILPVLPRNWSAGAIVPQLLSCRHAAIRLEHQQSSEFQGRQQAYHKAHSPTIRFTPMCCQAMSTEGRPSAPTACSVLCCFAAHMQTPSVYHRLKFTSHDRYMPL